MLDVMNATQDNIRYEAFSDEDIFGFTTGSACAVARVYGENGLWYVGLCDWGSVRDDICQLRIEPCVQFIPANNALDPVDVGTTLVGENDRAIGEVREQVQLFQFPEPQRVKTARCDLFFIIKAGKKSVIISRRLCDRDIVKKLLGLQS